MKVGYLDTSALLAIAFAEPGGSPIGSRIRNFQTLVSSNLLEAEFRSALLREGIASGGEELLSLVTWIYPNRPLTPEFRRVLGLGRLRGADLWHLACALYLAPRPHDLSFITADTAQRDLARRLGFTV